MVLIYITCWCTEEKLIVTSPSHWVLSLKSDNYCDWLTGVECSWRSGSHWEASRHEANNSCGETRLGRKKKTIFVAFVFINLSCGHLQKFFDTVLVSYRVLKTYELNSVNRWKDSPFFEYERKKPLRLEQRYHVSWLAEIRPFTVISIGLLTLTDEILQLC